MPPPRDFLARAAELLEEHVPDRGRLLWSDAGCQVFELRDDQCGGATVTVVAADGTETVSHVCGVGPDALQ